jgi:curved DNA-binding protein CbpA
MSASSSDSPTELAKILAWDGQLDELDYFELLGVTENADPVAIETAYHQFALQFHPDCHPACSPLVQQALTRVFQRGVEARRVLCDAELRSHYCLLRQRGVKRLADESAVIRLDLDRELPALHEHCRSAGAKLEAMSAARAWQRRDTHETLHRLTRALSYDGAANSFVEDCIQVIERRICLDK